MLSNLYSHSKSQPGVGPSPRRLNLALQFRREKQNQSELLNSMMKQPYKDSQAIY